MKLAHHAGSDFLDQETAEISWRLKPGGAVDLIKFAGEENLHEIHFAANSENAIQSASLKILILETN